MSLFSLNTERPQDTDKIMYVTLGAEFGKKKFKQFQKEVKASMGIDLDGAVYSRVAIEKSKVDGEDYYELSLNKNCFLPIAGRQLPILEREANDNDMSLAGFADSLNFILNDSRVYA